MPAPASLLEEALSHYHAGDTPPEPEPHSLSPELILVLPPDEAQAARALLPEREPFDEWLDRLRTTEPRTAPEPDWEFEEPRARGRLGGIVFAAVCVANAIVPIVLSLLAH